MNGISWNHPAAYQVRHHGQARSAALQLGRRHREHGVEKYLSWDRLGPTNLWEIVFPQENLEIDLKKLDFHGFLLDCNAKRMFFLGIILV